MTGKKKRERRQRGQRKGKSSVSQEKIGKEGGKEGERDREGHQRSRKRGSVRDARGEVAGEEGRGPRRVTEGGSLPQQSYPTASSHAPHTSTGPGSLAVGNGKQPRSCRKGEERQSLLGFGEQYCFVARTKHSTFQ